MPVGLEEITTNTEAQIVVSAAIALGAFASAYVVSRARRALSERVAPLAVDFAGAAFSVGIVVAAVVAIARVWEMTDQLAEYVGVGNIRNIAPQIAVTVVVLIAIQLFSNIARRLLDDITRESNAVSEHERELIYRLTQISLWGVGVIVVLGVWQVDLSGLLVGAGFVGIVFGLAARQTLGSLLGGLVLMFSRPFEVGDWVAVVEDEGIVTDITVMNTRIQAFDGEYIVVPNDVISSQTVKNRTQKGRLRIEVEVGIDYDADVERAREVVVEAIADLDILMDVPRAECVTKAFDESSITLGARGWIEHPSSRRRWRARTRMIRSIKEQFAAEEIKIPFPQRELTGRAESGGFHVSESSGANQPRNHAASPNAESVQDDELSSGRSAEDEPVPDSTPTGDGARTRSSEPNADGSRSGRSDGDEQ